MADKKYYLDQAGLSLYDENIKEYIDGADASTLSSAKGYTDSAVTKLTGGTTVVKEAQHAATADSATTANSATKATQDGNGNVISSTYETKADAASKLTEAKSYTDTEVAKKADAGHNHDTAYDAKGSAATAESNAKAYADSVGATVKSDLLGGAGAAYDTLLELSELIGDNADAIDALETVASGKADAGHKHSAADITSGTLSSDRLPTVPIAKGGTGATTAAGALTNLGLTATAAELNIMDGVTATATEINVLDGLTATTTELNYMDGVTSGVQVQLDALSSGKANSSHSHTITATATDDDVIVLTGTNGSNKVTYDAKHATSGVTAGTYKSVTVNAYGHVTAGTNPTSLSGYGITDAYTKTQVDNTVSGINTKITNLTTATSTNAASIQTNATSIAANAAAIANIDRIGDDFINGLFA